MLARSRQPLSGAPGATCVIEAGDQIKRGVLWLGSATIAGRLVDLGATVAVLSLLTQTEMGLAALVLSTCAVLESLSGLGLGQALVQTPTLSSDEEASLFWLTSGIGGVLGLAMVGAAPVLSSLYGEPSLIRLGGVSALKLVLIGMSVVPLQLLSRQLKFKEVGAVQSLSSLGEGLVKVALAWGGAGAWALIIGNVARGLVLLAALWSVSDFRPRAHFSYAQARRFVPFGLHVAGSGVLYQLYRNAGHFLVGKLLGIEALGLYRVAFDVAMQPTEALTLVVGRVAFPVFARVSGDARALSASFVRGTRSLILLAVPVAAIVSVSVGDLLALLGGSRWIEAVPAVQILVWAGLLRAAAHMFPQVYIALGRPEYAIADSALSFFLLSCTFWLGLVFFPELGVLSVCWIWLGAYPVLLAWHLALARRFMQLAPARYLRAQLPGAAVAVCIVGGLYALGAVLPAGLPSGLGLAARVALGLTIYVAFLRWVLRMRWRDLLPRRASAAS